MKAVVDTNVVFAYLYDKDPFHNKAVKIIEKYKRLILPSIVVFELIYLFYKYNIELNIIKYILYSDEIELVENTKEDIYYALDKNPRSYDDFNDYIILNTAKRLKVDLITFDEELKELFYD